MKSDDQSYRLADMTGPVFAALAKDNPVILLPLGSHEDHGGGIPMGDYVLAGLVADKIAAVCALLGLKVLIAPVLPFGVADFFGSSPGGLALSAASFRGVLNDVIGGLLRHGLTRLVILNGHGGNQPAIHEVTLNVKLAHGVEIPSIYLWKIAKTIMQRQNPGGAELVFGHEAEPLASINQVLRPGLKFDQTAPRRPNGMMLGLPSTDFGTIEFEGQAINVPAEFDHLPVDLTAQTPAPRELGEAVVAELAGFTARFIAHYVNITS